MKKEYQLRLTQNLTYLEKNLEVDRVVNLCYEKLVIEDTDFERIQAEGARPDKVVKFIKILQCKPHDKCYEIFLDVLCDHSVSQPFIRQQLEQTELPDDFEEDYREEELLRQTFQDCFTVKDGSSCPVKLFIQVVRVHLRQHGKLLTATESEVLHLAAATVAEVKLKKSKRGKTITTLLNWCVKPEALQALEECEQDEDDILDSPNHVRLQEISPERVAAALRVHLEKQGLDVALGERMEEEEIDGKSLSQLTEDHVKELYKGLSMGKRLRLMEAIKEALTDLQKPLQNTVREKKVRQPKKLETYRPFDTRPRSTDVYEKGCVLQEEQSRPGYLLQPIHKYHVIGGDEVSKLATETMRFAAACMNERVNGTIHFGVKSRFDPTHSLRAGEIVGLPINKEQCEVAVTEEIYRAFFADQREAALKCIRNPVYIPVVGKEVAANELFVVEVDVVPHSDVVSEDAFFLQPVIGKNAVLLKYTDGAPVEVRGKDLEDFMKFKKKGTDLRKDCEKSTRVRGLDTPDLHRKLHGLLTDENNYGEIDIFPLLFLSPCPDSMTIDVLMEYFECLKSLEPLAAFDFDSSTADSRGNPRGLYTMMESYMGQAYKALTTDNFDRTSDENKSGNHDAVSKLMESITMSSFKSWIFCNGYGPLDKEEMDAVTWRSKRGQGYKEAIRFYKEQIPEEKARIIILVLSRNYDVLLGALEEVFVKFPDQWILLAESERVVQDLLAEVVRRCYVHRGALEERCVIGMPWSHFNQSIKKICGYSSGTGCTLPSTTGTPCVMKEREKNGLTDLDILSISQCADDDLMHKGKVEEVDEFQRKAEEDFYRGKQVTWWNFYFGNHVRRRTQFDELKEKVEKALEGDIPEDEKVAVITLLHQPGAGGTTTAREILWELRKKVRCCVVKQITDQTGDHIARLRGFEEQDCPKPPLVLIDNEDEERVFQLCSYMNEKARREARDSRGAQKIFCVLIICVRMTAFPKKKDKSKVILDHELQPEEITWFRQKYETLEERYEKKKLGLHPKLLISFNILKENFNKDYIKSIVEEFISQIHEYKEKCLLKYIALINSFDTDFQPIPMSCFNVLMNPAKDRKAVKPRLGQQPFSKGTIHWETTLSRSLNVLLNRTSRSCMGGDFKAVRIISNNLSREILDNLCRRERQKVSDVVLELLHSDIFKGSNASRVQTQLIKIMKDILKKRAAFKKGRKKFSPIILEIGDNEGFEKAAEVLTVGFDRFDDPMIAQQLARVYIHSQNWTLADKTARAAQNLKPKNSYLCDTHGQVFKEQLIRIWKECLENEKEMEAEKARDVVDMAFKAMEIFRREQRLSDEDCSTGYNNCGFFSELRVVVTLLDCCRFMKAFKCDKGEKLHKFLVDQSYIPPELMEELGQDRISLLKKLYFEYERPMRRLEDEQIQLKEDTCYQYSPGYSNSVRDRQMFVHLQECLDTYFGEESDQVPPELKGDAACEFRRRRVKRKGGNSLRSIYGLRDDDNANVEFRDMYRLIEKNVKSPHCNAFDLRTILNITLARISLDKRCAREISMDRILEWTSELYSKTKSEAASYLEAYLYLVMFHWPTDWRNRQGLQLSPCNKIKDVMKEWKAAFQNNHPAQKEEEGKKPDRRKGTTLFFLGQGEGFDEIVFYNELRGYSRGQKLGDGIWDTDLAKDRLKRLKGTLLHGGGEMSVTIVSAKGNAVQLEIPTSFPIKDHSLWQKKVQFVLGFCWSGPKAYSVTRDDNVDLRSVPTPQNFTVRSRKVDRSQQKAMSLEAVEEFWQRYFANQVLLERLDTDIKLCSNMHIKRKLEQKKKKLEKDREELVDKRTSVLQGPD
nr:hypothetical protein BaRGS_001315 [Batillaria attramentaria]